MSDNATQQTDVVVIIGNQQDRTFRHSGLILAQSTPEVKVLSAES